MPPLGQVAAIVAAGGTGERTGGPDDGEPKQFRDLAGRPVVSWALEMLTEAGFRPVIAVVPEDWIDRMRDLGASCRGLVCVAGGSTRQASVANGLAMVETSSVVVHDAARPLATPALARAVLDALSEADAAVPAVPVEDTVKTVEGGRVVETLDRTGLWAVQTPQAFVADALRRAHAAAAKGGYDATDDAQLVERNGGRVAVVPGERWNLKLTFPVDFDLAAALVNRRR